MKERYSSTEAMATKMARGMVDKKMLTELGSFTLEKKTVFIFLNGIAEKMEIDLVSTYTLEG